VGKLASVFDEMIGKLDEAFSSQRLFLGDASHELRTPLTIVRGQLELLQQEGLSPQGTRSVNVGLDEVDRMSRIVEDLLLLARLDEGLSMKSEPVEVELVLQESLVRAKAIADRTVGVDAEEGVFILGDFDRLLQVISNLVSNAIRHAGDGASLTLKSKREDGSVRIEVTDTGRGIAPEDISRVFDRLYRGAGPQTDSPAGAGLGLAIAASLVEAMKGTIVVSSTLGVGTTFTLMFPETRVPDSSPSEWSSGSAARDSLSS
jgi:signal transduction histidine kinase